MTRFFNELSKENQELLLSIGSEITLESGTFLFHEGDFSQYVYLIRSGKVHLSKNTSDGKVLSVHLKQEDELVGEHGLFNDMSISVTARVVEDAVLVRFNRSALEEIFTLNGEVAVTFMKWIVRNTQSTQAKFRDLLLGGKTGAFYSTLIRFSNSYGLNSEEGTLIKVQLTNQDLATYSGTTRETVNRMLSELKKDKVVSINKGFITIKNMQFLKSHLNCGDCPAEICSI